MQKYLRSHSRNMYFPPSVWLTLLHTVSPSLGFKNRVIICIQYGPDPRLPSRARPGRVRTGNAYPEPPIPQHPPIPFRRGILGRGHISTRPLAVVFLFALLVASRQRQGTGGISSPGTGAADLTIYR